MKNDSITYRRTPVVMAEAFEAALG